MTSYAGKLQSKSAFIEELTLRINDYFFQKKRSKKGELVMTLKIITGFLWWGGSYVLLFIFHIKFWQFVGLYTIQGLSHLFITFNIAHEANHNSLSENSSINKLLRFSFDLCGINSYMWRILHNTGHHYCINIEGEDEAIIGRGIFRFSPHAPVKKRYRYQHLYAIFFYGLVTLDYTMVKDFKYFFFSNYRYVKNVKHHTREYIILFLGKLSYFAYMILLPALLLSFSFWAVILAFFIMHFILGVSISLIFQISHVISTNEFPKCRDEFEFFTYHVLATTSDYATRSKIANWFLGGFNQHVIHHFYPHICHTHYPVLTEILKATSEKYGVEYKESKSIFGAMMQHFILLKRLGTMESTIAY